MIDQKIYKCTYIGRVCAGEEERPGNESERGPGALLLLRILAFGPEVPMWKRSPIARKEIVAIGVGRVLRRRWLKVTKLLAI